MDLPQGQWADLVEEEGVRKITELPVEVVDTLGGSGTHSSQAGGGGGSYCSGQNCSGAKGTNRADDGIIIMA